VEFGFCRSRRGVSASAALFIGACAFLCVSISGATAAVQATAPNLVTGSAYLVSPGNLIEGHYYESFPGTADFGLTIDGALALAATGDDDAALRRIVAFIDDNGRDPSGDTANEWTGIGTSYASGGAIGKEALLAEVVGGNPRTFGGHNLIAALNASVCTRASHGGNTSCPAAGAYLNDTSVFDQALGVIAQFRAGQAREAAAPVAYLESLQSSDGSFPSLIPASGGPDVDSTAMAVMALALAPGPRAAADVAAGVSWIASRQERNGGFPSGGAESINSTGLAIQALTLRATAQETRVRAALAFLASQQNSNGGFNVDAGQHGSNLRASTQAVGGAVGTSFGTLRIDLAISPKAQSSPPTRRANGTSPSRSRPRPSATTRARADPGGLTANRQQVRGPARPHDAADIGDAAPRGFTADSLLIASAAAIFLAVAALVLGQIFGRRRRALVEPESSPSPHQVSS
jgi:hypothetical protein